MAKPRVSVLIPAFNVRRYVRKTLQSLWCQTWADFEVVVVNDGSTDGTGQILEIEAQCNERLRVFHQPNQGQAVALNFALREAHGDLLIRIDADDLALPTRIERQIQFMDVHREVVAAGSNVYLVDSSGWKLGIERKAPTHEEIDAQLMQGFGGAICASASILRRTPVERIGGWNVGGVEDLDICLKLAEVGRLANSQEVLACYRKHSSAMSYAGRERMVNLARQVVADAALRRGINVPCTVLDNWKPTDSASHHREWATFALANGFKAASLKHALLAMIKAHGAADGLRFCKYIVSGLIRSKQAGCI